MLPAERRDRLRTEFGFRTGRQPAGVWSAPGRANLIGEHLDYNGGWVLPFAIGLRTAVAVVLRNDNRIRCWSLQNTEVTDVSLDDDVPKAAWSSYVIGTVWALREAGAQVRGLDIVVDGDVPLGGGLSSSAALECAVAIAVNELSGGVLDRRALALAGQRAEHDVVGAPVGIMDQLVSLSGREGHGVLIDCATLESRDIRLPLSETGTRLLVIDTGVRHDNASGGYADRRRDCETAAAALGVDHLARADPARLAEIDNAHTRRRARHVMSEQQRVHDVVDALSRDDMVSVGAALTACHVSLRDDFEVSTPELDGAVAAALQAGALGARLTGGGFGGAVLALVPEAAADAVFAAVCHRAAEAGWPTPRQYDGRPRGGARRENELGMSRTNWAGNVAFQAAAFHSPASVADLQQLVADTAHVRAVGTGHSFSPIADSRGDLVSLAGLPQVRLLDAANSTVTVSAATRYGEIAEWLEHRGYALRNLASLPHISVAGACATATHGSGDGLGNLATAVRGMQVVTADGALLQLTRERDAGRFDATSVGLGALGIVTTLTLEVVPTYDVRQLVYDDLPFQTFCDHVAEVFGSGYSVSLFTDFRDSRFTQIWRKERVDNDAPPVVDRQFLGAALADGPRHPVPGLDPVHCTQQGGVPGPWHERLPHFRLDYVPSNGDELQSEYLLPRGLVAAALAALDGIATLIAPVLLVCELRSVAADRLWLSPSYGRDTVGFHFTWINNVDAVAPVLTAIERQLEPYDATPHWGKLFAMPPERLAERFERLPDFRAMRARHDPGGKFGNHFVDQYLAGG